MKLKNLLFLLAIAIVFAITACGGNDDGSATSATTVAPTSDPPPPPVPIPIEMVQIPGGSFSVSSGTVTLTAFKISKHEVTQAQWQTVMGSNPSVFKGNNLPVETVNWYETLVFCNKLSMNEGLTSAYRINGSTNPADWGAVPYYDWNTGTIIGDATSWNAVEIVIGSNGYRLPTEVQWQYAAQGGSSAEVTVTDATGWYSANSNNTTHEVGQKETNVFGLYDMLGNVWEWCWDWWGGTYPSGAIDPMGASSGTYRMARGGGWSNPAEYARSALRDHDFPDGRNVTFGFRLVLP